MRVSVWERERIEREKERERERMNEIFRENMRDIKGSGYYKF